ncbi:putative iron-only hydrogenase system regulator [Caldanaerovirga acetigignens]|uniref:Putative iron-only hydrogenase system regulator n=1 Tax=Caldanaerovirga acetigignens TaxID=447595 RepID=A0A1M7FVB0_9FIRM|nr:TM1266 family iron-only hydrogenase system putative regulator [Caldanaerovirga acetigignens]SHM07845.1 putative iron-only hydrogenase system regulator [Caldanaerovirga acetigignens]
MAEEKRLSVVGIIVYEREKSAAKVNEILSKFGDMIVGRMGIPYKERGISVIALIVDATTDELGALTGKLGQVPGVKVKSAVTA